MVWKGVEGCESDFYHPDSKVLHQENAWLDEDTAVDYFKYALPIMESAKDCFEELNPTYPNPLVLIQQDNLECQNCKRIKSLSWMHDCFIWNTPENTTDCTAFSDDWVLGHLKYLINEAFWKDFTSSVERCEWYTNAVKDGGIKAYEWRILITHWVYDSWSKVKKKRGAILASAKHVGFANCACGCENNLIAVGKLTSYEVGSLSDPIPQFTPEVAAAMAMADKRNRAEEKSKAKKRDARSVFEKT